MRGGLYLSFAGFYTESPLISLFKLSSFIFTVRRSISYMETWAVEIIIKMTYMYVKCDQNRHSKENKRGYILLF